MALACAGAAAVGAPGQLGPLPELAAVAHAVERWLQADPPSEAAREAAAAAVLDAGQPALEWLGAALQSSMGMEMEVAQIQRRQALESLVVLVALRFLDRVAESGMVFTGQYAPLRKLQPYAGNLYLALLLDTPDWFPDDRRDTLVPALRDLFPDGPDDAELARIRQLADDEELEPEDLRVALGYALAQWGDRHHVERRLRGLHAELETATGTDRVDILRKLAGAHYALRDYRSAGLWYLNAIAAAEVERYALPPIDYYNAACCLCLSGSLEQALAQLQTCVRLLRSDRTDRSLLLRRELFERDPELDPIRGTERFKALLLEAFPPSDSRPDNADLPTRK